MKLSIPELAFAVQIETWLSASYTAGVSNFPDLLRATPGVYPTEVLRALDRIAAQIIYPDRVAWAVRLIGNAKKVPAEARVDWCGLVPHPLDYDWRFTPECAAWIANLAERLSMEALHPTPVYLLGTPSVHRALRKQQRRCRAFLLDRNPPSGVGDAWGGNITQGVIPNLPLSNLIVTDPPWYPEYFRSFLWTAAQLAAPGARVFCGIPGVGTRPGIESEWSEVVEWASTAGFAFVGLHNEATEYLTSPFEANALRAAGIVNVPLRWRRASLAEFCRVGPNAAARPPEPDEGSWGEVTTGIVRWRVRLESVSREASPGLASIVPGDVLSSVSRRDPTRAKAVVWTSGNRIFDCRNSEMLRYILEALQGFKNEIPQPSQLVQRLIGKHPSAKACPEVDQAVRDVLRLYELETEEYGES